MWITSQECYEITVCADERICNDTFLRVEKQKDDTYVVSDIWIYNSNCVFACSTFQQRYNWLKEWIPMFIRSIPGTANIIHKSDWKETNHRGQEVYTNEIGTYGFFTEQKGVLVTIIKTNIPDCYDVKSHGGYLKVPTLKDSQYLRTRGNEFQEYCTRNEDESWSLVSNQKTN